MRSALARQSWSRERPAQLPSKPVREEPRTVDRRAYRRGFNSGPRHRSKRAITLMAGPALAMLAGA